VAPEETVSVLISGESGTGKELVARALHRASRRSGPFIAVNCGSLPSTLLEAELFGYRRGAFSGATEDRLGLVRAADRGTLFLDEIGDLAMPSQVALLRVLQEKEVLPLGTTRPVKVDLRVASATHRDLHALVEKGQFRADLHARLGGYKITLPRLADRREDLGLIISAVIRRRVSDPDRTTITCRAARALFLHTWPLNIRELEKCLTTAAALAGHRAIDTGHLPDEIRSVEARMSSTPPVELGPEDAERRAKLLSLLRAHDGNVAQVAAAMGKAPMQIHRWIKRYAIDLREFRE
jgi:sigma-54 dependent transcriptional regulator, acetoin dehydrogenase operon transcriptional activator AcoR